MNVSRERSWLIAIAILSQATSAQAAEPLTPQTAVLNTYQTIWVNGDTRGPTQNGVPRIGKNTGAGLMDAHFAFETNVSSTGGTSILLGTTYTRSASTPNPNAANESFMQGGFALATLTEKGVTLGATVDLPTLDGERTFMRPLIGFTTKYTVLIAASEDNGINNNPQPVLFLANKTTGELQPIANSTRGRSNLAKPTNLIQTALNQGIRVENPNDQRGPHSIAQISSNSFLVGMQYNNTAAEAFRVTVEDSGNVTVNWLTRYSNNGQHCRPQVAVAGLNATEGFLAEVEANSQPADIGFRLTKFNTGTGKSIQSKIAVRSDPANNRYVAEPSLAVLGDSVAVGYALSASVRRERNGENGHAGGSQVAALALFRTADLSMVGTPMLNAAAYGRHASMFGTTYGPSSAPAVAYIAGSSTGTKGAFEQIIPLTETGTLGVKDPAKLYAVSSYSDVANVQARGKRNPNNQARGFINGLGSVPNPGFGKGNTAFMPDVKSLSFSTITGYTDDAAAQVGKRNSIWLSLVPAVWAEGIPTTPGTPTATPGTTAQGAPSTTGPAPRTTAIPTNPAAIPEASPMSATTAAPGSAQTTAPPSVTPDNSASKTSGFGLTAGGCSVRDTSTVNQQGIETSLLLFSATTVAYCIHAFRRRKRDVDVSPAMTPKETHQ